MLPDRVIYTTKDFDPAALASITTGVLLVNFDDLIQVMQWITGEMKATFGATIVCDRVAAEILR